MIVDLHAHYPMHLDPGIRGNVIALLKTRRGQLRISDYFRALLVHIASQFRNYPSLFSGPRVRVPWMVDGHVGVALSVLYSFFDEVDTHPGEKREYLDEILRQADLVQTDIAGEHAGAAVVALNRTQLEDAIDADKLALVHCVEGGFHLLGEDPAAVEAAVEALADRGIAYITLAHLFWRGVATGANAFPNMSDEQYAKRCKQPPIGLTERGRAAVRAMVRRHVVIDLSHMSERSVHDTFDLLDELDPARSAPVYATHGACRFAGTQEYNLSPDTIERIAARDGVIGLIFAQHQLYDGLEKKKRKGFDDSFAALCAHINEIHRITGSHRHVAIGSDFDGFIKPTLGGLRDMRDMAMLDDRLHEAFGSDGELISSQNALRPLRSYWLGAPG